MRRRVARAAGGGGRGQGLHCTWQPCIALARPWVRPLPPRPARPGALPAFLNFNSCRAAGTRRRVAGQPGRGRAHRRARLPARPEVRVCGGCAAPPRVAPSCVFKTSRADRVRGRAARLAVGTEQGRPPAARGPACSKTASRRAHGGRRPLPPARGAPGGLLRRCWQCARAAHRARQAGVDGVAGAEVDVS